MSCDEALSQSYRLGENPEALRQLVNRSGHAALVFNALDGYGTGRLKNYDREAEDIAALGFDCSELDLRSYFNDFEGLRTRLGGVELLWVVGGNTFVLARAMTGVALRRGGRWSGRYRPSRLCGLQRRCMRDRSDLDGCHLIDEPDVIPDGLLARRSTDDARLAPLEDRPSLAVRSRRGTVR